VSAVALPPAAGGAKQIARYRLVAASGKTMRIGGVHDALKK
jgi:hypothetical protein